MGLWKTACHSLAQTREMAQIYGIQILIACLLAHIHKINRRTIHNARVGSHAVLPSVAVAVCMCVTSLMLY